VGGTRSCGKNSSESRRKPRTRPMPPPCFCAVATAATKSASTPSSFALSRKRCAPATNVIGTPSSRRARASRRDCAWLGERPPTSTPAMRVPLARCADAPAKRSGSTTATATSSVVTSTTIRVQGRARAGARRRTAGDEAATPPGYRSLEDEQLDAARDVELDAGDVPGEVGAEECDRVRDVLRLAGALEDRPVRDPLVHRRVRHVKRLGADDPGNDRVGGDPVAAALHRKRLRQSEKPGLRRRVRRLAEAAERARDGGHVDDAPEAALLHVRPDRLRTVEGTTQVDAEVALPECGVLIAELADVVERASVVDQDVDRAEFVDGARDRGCDLLAVGDVALDGERPPPERTDLLGRRLRADEALRACERRERAVLVGLFGEVRLDEQVGDHDVCARAGERERVRASEPARAAGDECDLAGEIDLDHPRGMKISFAI